MGNKASHSSMATIKSCVEGRTVLITGANSGLVSHISLVLSRIDPMFLCFVPVCNCLLTVPAFFFFPAVLDRENGSRRATLQLNDTQSWAPR